MSQVDRGSIPTVATPPGRSILFITCDWVSAILLGAPGGRGAGYSPRAVILLTYMHDKRHKAVGFSPWSWRKAVRKFSRPVANRNRPASDRTGLGGLS